VCALIFSDNVLRKMGGPGNPIGGGWRRVGRRSFCCPLAWMLACQFRFWSGIVERSNTRRVDEKEGASSLSAK
jgi:hypothetical protein